MPTPIASSAATTARSSSPPAPPACRRPGYRCANSARTSDMYRKHFALTRHPFGQEIGPDELFPSASSRELAVRLAHLLDLRRIGLVTGDRRRRKTPAARRALT